MILIDEQRIQSILENAPEGKNTRFLFSSHNLWKRFQNYYKALPLALEVNGEIVSIIFATFNKNFYTNLYEIVTVEGHEGKGYASELWQQYTQYAVNERKMKRLKISCTPSSITWHLRNGLIFWGVDPTGSLKSDQPLFPDRQTQIDMRNLFAKRPVMALPSEKVIEQLKSCQLKNYNFSISKKETILDAIQKVGRFWFGGYLEE